jgi:hypothetical protein
MFKVVVASMAGSLAKMARQSGLSKNEKIVVGGYKYPVDEFLGYSDEKIRSIIEGVPGCTEEQVQLTFTALKSMGRK